MRDEPENEGDRVDSFKLNLSRTGRIDSTYLESITILIFSPLPFLCHLEQGPYGYKEKQDMKLRRITPALMWIMEPEDLKDSHYSYCHWHSTAFGITAYSF